MKTFTLKLKQRTLKDSIKAMRRAAKSGTTEIYLDQLFCDSYDDMITILSKAAVMAAIIEHKPKSIFALAKKMNRDAANVSRDVQLLAKLGIIEFAKEKDGGRERLRPIAKYDQILTDLSTPKIKKVG